MKNQKLLIWENSQNIKKHRLAYSTFIEALKVNLDLLKAITGQKLDEKLFQDILNGCELVKANVSAESEAKIQNEKDPDLKELFAEKLQSKIQKIDVIYQQIKTAKETKSSSIDSIHINNQLLSYKNGHIIFDETPIIKENSIFLDSEAKQLLYSQAENIKNLIEEFERSVQKLTNKKQHCINYAGYSDNIFLQIDHNYGIEINPFAFDAIEE
jgi:hypothetical protein